MTGKLTDRYRIQAGDNLWRIAARHYGDGRHWPLIANANGLAAPYTIFAGCMLTLPPRYAAANHGRVGSAPPPLLARPTSGPSVGGSRLNINSLIKSSIDDAISKDIQRQAAQPVQYPPLKATFETRPQTFPIKLSVKQEVGAPTPQIRITCNGELVIKKAGLVGIELDLAAMKAAMKSKNGKIELAAEGKPFGGTDELSVQIKNEYTSKIADLLADASFSFNPITKTAEISCKLALVAKVNGKKFVTASVTPKITMDGYIIKFEPEPVRTAEFEGNIGFDVDLTTRKDLQLSRVPVPIAIRELDVKYILVSEKEHSFKAPVGAVPWIVAIVVILVAAKLAPVVGAALLLGVSTQH